MSTDGAELGMELGWDDDLDDGCPVKVGLPLGREVGQSDTDGSYEAPIVGVSEGLEDCCVSDADGVELGFELG